MILLPSSKAKSSKEMIRKFGALALKPSEKLLMLHKQILGMLPFFEGTSLAYCRLMKRQKWSKSHTALQWLHMIQ